MRELENELWVVEYNPKQKAFHIQELKRASETSIRELLDGRLDKRKSDFWVILVVVKGYTEASKSVDILRRKLEERRNENSSR